MEFQLPEHLQAALVQYDRTKPKVARTSPSKQVGKSFPLGKLEPLIPLEIISKEEQLNAIAVINASELNDRYYSWNETNGTNVDKLKAFVAHYESTWYAAWFPPAGEDYIYGVTVCLRDTYSVRASVFGRLGEVRILTPSYTVRNKQVPGESNWQKVGLSVDDFLPIKIGRSGFLIRSIKVTKEMIVNGFDATGWDPPRGNGSWSKGQNYRNLSKSFAERLKETVPCWTDNTQGVFSRLVDGNNTLWHCLSKAYMSGTHVKHYMFKAADVPLDKFKWELDSMITQFQLQGVLAQPDKSVFYQKPAVRKIINQAMMDSANAFQQAQGNDPAFWQMRLVSAPLVRAFHWLQWCDAILTVWPDCSLDHLLNNYHTLQHFAITPLGKWPIVTEWLRTNMPVTSLFGIFNNLVRNIGQEDQPRVSEYKVSMSTHISLSDLTDTLTSISRILGAGKTLDKPKRWRLSTFHDHCVSESWKVQHTKVALPQDMFPVPSNIQVDGSKFCFFQPIDTHQLAEWGRAARNCVGYSNYANGIKNKTHFIILIMEDHKPRYTAQAKLVAGILQVSQMNDVGNRSIPKDKLDVLQKALGQALMLRQAELVNRSSHTLTSAPA